MEEEPDIIESPLSRKYEAEGIAAQVEIYSSGKDDWILEVIDASNASTVWDDPFPTDQLALDEFFRTVRSEGIRSLVGEHG